MAASILTDGEKVSFNHRTHADLESSDVTTWILRACGGPSLEWDRFSTRKQQDLEQQEHERIEKHSLTAHRGTPNQKV